MISKSITLYHLNNMSRKQYISEYIECDNIMLFIIHDTKLNITITI